MKWLLLRSHYISRRCRGLGYFQEGPDKLYSSCLQSTWKQHASQYSPNHDYSRAGTISLVFGNHRPLSLPKLTVATCGEWESASPLKKDAKFPAADDYPPHWDYRRVATGESDNSVLCRYVKKGNRTYSRDHRGASSSSLAADQKLQEVSLPDHQDKVQQTLL